MSWLKKNQNNKKPPVLNLTLLDQWQTHIIYNAEDYSCHSCHDKITTNYKRKLERDWNTQQHKIQGLCLQWKCAFSVNISFYINWTVCCLCSIAQLCRESHRLLGGGGECLGFFQGSLPMVPPRTPSPIPVTQPRLPEPAVMDDIPLPSVGELPALNAAAFESVPGLIFRAFKKQMRSEEESCADKKGVSEQAT